MLAPIANTGSNYLISNYISPRYQDDASAAAKAGISYLSGGDPTMALINYGVSLLPSNIQASISPGLQGMNLGMMAGNLAGVGAGAGAALGLPLGVMAGMGAGMYGSYASDRKRKHAAQQLSQQLSGALKKYTDPTMLAAELTKNIPKFLQEKGLPPELANNPKFKEFYLNNAKKMFNNELKKIEENLKYSGVSSPELKIVRATLEGPQSDYYKQTMANIQEAKTKPGYYEQNKSYFDTLESGLTKNVDADAQSKYYLYGGRQAERRGLNPYASDYSGSLGSKANEFFNQPEDVIFANGYIKRYEFDQQGNQIGFKWVPRSNTATTPTTPPPSLTVSETVRANPGVVPSFLTPPTQNVVPTSSPQPQTQLTPISDTASVQPIAPTAPVTQPATTATKPTYAFIPASAARWRDDRYFK